MEGKSCFPVHLWTENNENNENNENYLFNHEASVWWGSTKDVKKGNPEKKERKTEKSYHTKKNQLWGHCEGK